MDHIWTAHGLPMDPLWTIYGPPSMDLLWTRSQSSKAQWTPNGPLWTPMDPLTVQPGMRGARGL
jgi:hypothetical protein